MSNGYVIRQLRNRDGKDELTIAMIIEEEDLGGDHGMEQVIIPESSETGKRLWECTQREDRSFPFSPAAFGQPAGIKATRLNAYTQVAQNSRNGPIPKDHCIVTINGTRVIVPDKDLYVIPTT